MDKTSKTEAVESKEAPEYETVKSATEAYSAINKRLEELESKATATPDFQVTHAKWNWIKQCISLLFRRGKMPLPKEPE